MANITLDRDANGTPVFVIGLTMAGAISAGAYTAGVVDYLMRAMHAHNARVGTPGGPCHKVVVKAMSGASAGGICAGLIASNLFAVGETYSENGVTKSEPTWDAPQSFTYNGKANQSAYVLRRIYQAWVTDVKMWDPVSKSGLLALGDFESGKLLFDQEIAKARLTTSGKIADAITKARAKAGPVSVLNGAHLDQVAEHALAGIPAWGSTHPGYDFIASDLDLFLTTTAINPNIYKIDFRGGDPCVLEEHSIVRHFRMKRLGSGPALASPWLAAWRDEGITLDPTAVPAGNDLPLMEEDGGDWAQLTVASIASGAFPLGLAPRIVAATPLELGMLPPTGNAKGGALPYDIPVQQVVRPDFKGTAIGAYTPYVAVDGGMANNEPFGCARYTIRQKDPNGHLLDNPRPAGKAHRAVLMVDPFPEGAAFSVLNDSDIFKMLGLLPVVKKMIGVFTGQARFKPAELVHASDPDVYSRFLISPRRTPDGGEPVKGKWAIACGLLSGFGGFFDEAFRQHDFVLGQRNCQKFLESTFTLDAGNLVLNLPAGQNTVGTTKPVIDPGAMAGSDTVELFTWPRMSGRDFEIAQAQLRKRLDIVVKKEATALEKGWIKRGWWLAKKYGVVDDIVCSVVKDLILRDQLACLATDPEGAIRSDAERVALAGLAGSGSTSVSAKELHDRIIEAQKKGELKPQDKDIPPPEPAQLTIFLNRLKDMGVVHFHLKYGFGVRKYKINLDWIYAA